jgi:hypothetical protein
MLIFNTSIIEYVERFVDTGAEYIIYFTPEMALMAEQVELCLPSERAETVYPASATILTVRTVVTGQGIQWFPTAIQPINKRRPNP